LKRRVVPGFRLINVSCGAISGSQLWCGECRVDGSHVGSLAMSVARSTAVLLTRLNSEGDGAPPKVSRSGMVRRSSNWVAHWMAVMWSKWIR
jgi:hypothetical protein